MRQARHAWAPVGVLGVLCCTLAVLQYRWIGEVSRGERERLRDGLQASLQRLSQDFNSELNTACAALLPSPAEIEQSGRDAAYASRYAKSKETGRHDRLFRRVALAVPANGDLTLLNLDPEKGVFQAADWPAGWQDMRERLRSRLKGAPMRFSPEESALIELPRFGLPKPGAPPGPLGRSEQEWLLLEVDIDYVRSAMLPELIASHLGEAYEIEVTARANPSTVIYRAGPDRGGRIAQADGSVTLFEPQFAAVRRRAGFFRGPGKGPPSPPPSGDSGRGRWVLSVRHREGSLDAIVERARWRNLGVSAGILLLILAAAGTLLRFSRQAHRLAELQMNFVAGVSHELRTPLAVIRTAAFNLRGKLASNPSQVERYGALIQQESEKLADILDQVLRFAGAKAGQVIRERAPVPVEAVIENALASSKAILESAGCRVEKEIEPGLPAIVGDSLALQHAVQNLINNAVKYGTEGSNWIGVYGATTIDRNRPVVEIRVADRGPGIPANEQEQIFEPFFRGSRAVEAQVHGTGLGLNLVKQIVEAHGGTIAVKSEARKGTEFTIRIPAAGPEHQDEFAHTSHRG